ncbi:MAG: hypothetical protein B7733_16635 [Myxococcales bacterium FL481]|nr:MAG: hypothetical protein B7733_16635 [Myxococcales bacterium FL481]
MTQMGQDRARLPSVMTDRQYLDELPQGPLELSPGDIQTIQVRTVSARLLDAHGQPFAGERYDIEEDGKSIAQGQLDNEGLTEAIVAYNAAYRVRFPALADNAWSNEPFAEAPAPSLDTDAYRVARAETLAMVLYRERGLLDPNPVLAADKNRFINSARAQEILHAGDLVYLPVKGPRGERRHDLAIGECDEFHVAGVVRRLKLVLKRNGDPLRETSYELVCMGATRSNTTDGDGLLDEPIPYAATEAELFVNGVTRRLVLGGIDPVHTVTGVQARLSNLGYHSGAVDGRYGPITRRSVRKFQAAKSLVVDAIVGPSTRAGLLAAYGR